MTTSRNPIVAASAAGVTVVVDVAAGLPTILYWGPELPGLTADDLAGMRATRVPVPGTNNPDLPLRVAMLPELHAGWTGRPGISGSRGGRAWSPRFTVEDVRLDGRSVTDPVVVGACAIEVDAVDDEAGLSVRITVELLPGGLLRSRAALTNVDDDVYDLAELVLAYPVPAEAAEQLDFAGRHEHERSPQRGPFDTGIHLRENRKGRTGADSAFVLHAGTPGFGFGHGEIHAVHTAWSGNHVHYAEQVFTGERLLGGGELLLPGEIRLGPGEVYTSPWLYGSTGTGLDEVARRFHRHQRSRPRPVGPDRSVTLNVWEAVYFDHDVPRLLDLADRAAAVGVERFVLDDGWFGSRRDDRSGLGDWVVAPDVWPDGLHPLVDRVRGLGMEFGLWVEPEMVNADSDVARAHPEWIMAARREPPLESRHQQVLDLGIPAAYAHVRGQLLALLDVYDIGCLKWDHNRDLVEAGDATRGGRPGVHAQTTAVHRLLDELRAAHPRLEIESCASGGARIDLAILERTDRVWVSDCIDPHERQAMMRWTTQLVPPEYLGAHIASGRSHTTGRVHDLGFRAATAVFGHLGVEWDLARATEEETAGVQAWIAFHKRHRGLLLAGDVVRMDTPTDAVAVHGVVAPDRSRAIIAMVTLATTPTAHMPPLRFRGLDAGRRYRLRPLTVGAPPSGLRPPAWWPECVLPGAVLEHAGVAAPAVHPDQVVLFSADAV